MSGYLHRLTQSVMAPAERVHPVVGSVHAPQKPETEPEATVDFADQEQIRETSDPPQPALPPRETEKPARDEKIAYSRAEARPSAAKAPQVALETPNETRVPTPIPREEIRISQATETTAPASVTYPPLMPVAPQIQAMQFFAPPQPMLPAQPRSAKLQPASVQHEPDEIQIHIGRVEVIAVPQPTATVASKTPRKSAGSLDDYLRRRDRRPL